MPQVWDQPRPGVSHGNNVCHRIDRRNHESLGLKGKPRFFNLRAILRVKVKKGESNQMLGRPDSQIIDLPVVETYKSLSGKNHFLQFLSETPLSRSRRAFSADTVHFNRLQPCLVPCFQNYRGTRTPSGLSSKARGGPGTLSENPLVSKLSNKQEAMENFAFPDNLQGMLIFCQMAICISEYSALQNVQFSN